MPAASTALTASLYALVGSRWRPYAWLHASRRSDDAVPSVDAATSPLLPWWNEPRRKRASPSHSSTGKLPLGPRRPSGRLRNERRNGSSPLGTADPSADAVHPPGAR